MTATDDTVGYYGVTVEKVVEERVQCIWRNGEAFFAFYGEGGEHRVLVHADSHLALLHMVRSHPQKEDTVPQGWQVREFEPDDAGRVTGQHHPTQSGAPRDVRLP
jgi:hypothetical protein